MSCEWQDLVILAQMDELGVSEGREAKSHLLACEECQQAVAAYQRVIDRAKSNVVPEPSAAAWQRIEINLWDKIEQRKRSSWWTQLRHWVFPEEASFQPSWALAGLIAFLFLPPMLNINFAPSSKPLSSSTAAEEALSQLEHLPDYVPMEGMASEKSAGSISAVSSEAILAYLDDYAQIAQGEPLSREEAMANNRSVY